MTEVTVIAPNVVELVGNLTRQSTAVPERTPPPPPPRTDAQPKARQDIGDRGQRLAANQNAPVARPAVPKTTSPGGFNLFTTARRRPNLPSVQFLTQLLAQQTDGKSLAPRPSLAALAAYDRAKDSQPRDRNEPHIVMREINQVI